MFALAAVNLYKDVARSLDKINLNSFEVIRVLNSCSIEWTAKIPQNQKLQVFFGENGEFNGRNYDPLYSQSFKICL